MKARKLIIHNIGMIRDTTVEINKPLIIFFGQCRVGKSTILNAVRWLFGGGYPSDLITHGQEEAFVELEFDNNSLIRREWYRGRDATVKDRPIIFIKDGKPIKKPVDEIKKFLNPFLLDQNYLFKMGETERKAYFTQLFAVDTSELDKEMVKRETDARDLRSKIKGYGHIDLTEVKPIDATALKNQLETIRSSHNEAVRQVNEDNKRRVLNNQKVGQAQLFIEGIKNSIAEMEEKIKSLKEELVLREKWLEENPILTETSLPEPPDTSKLESQIADAAANEVRVEQYKTNLKRHEEKKADEAELNDIEKRLRDLKKEKIATLAKISETCGIKELSFDESGNFIYQGTQAGMLSTSQLIKLSEELSALYPEGLGLSLLDRAESLGKSIFDFIKKAEEEEKSILATIVGECPAKIPEHVGVFVVSEGNVVPVEDDFALEKETTK